jgi:hypothetical protein
MVWFDTSKLQPGDVLAVRNNSGWFAKGIRAVLGSYTNHNAMIVPYGSTYRIAEAVQPKSTVTKLADYETAIEMGEYVVRVWRLRKMSEAKRAATAEYFVNNLLGIKYPLSVGRLWVMRFVNSLPWKIHHDNWCTALVVRALQAQDTNCLDRPDGKKKRNWTPRSLENRFVAGLFLDVTRDCLFNGPAAR